MNAQDFTIEEPDKSAVWSRMSYEEKNRTLYERQVALLDLFLSKHAIDSAQYEKSLHNLTAKFKRYTQQPFLLEDEHDRSLLFISRRSARLPLGDFAERSIGPFMGPKQDHTADVADSERRDVLLIVRLPLRG